MKMPDTLVKPKVSIIVCTYNYGKYIKRCLDALTCQTLKEIEIIVIDNHSTDNTEELVRPYLADKRVKYIRNPENYKAYHSYLIGFQMAVGEYVGISDADDFHTLDAFEKLYYAAVRSNADIASGNCVDAPTNRELNAFPSLTETEESLWNVVLSFRNLPMMQASIFKKTIIEAALQDFPPNYRVTHGVDELLSLALYYHARKRVHLSDRIYNHCQNISSFSATVSVDNRTALISEFGLILDFLNEMNLKYNKDKKYDEGIWATNSWHTRIAYYALRVCTSQEETISLWDKNAPLDENCNGTTAGYLYCWKKGKRPNWKITKSRLALRQQCNPLKV